MINTKLVEQEMLISLLQAELEEMEKIYFRFYIRRMTVIYSDIVYDFHVHVS